MPCRKRAFPLDLTVEKPQAKAYNETSNFCRMERRVFRDGTRARVDFVAWKHGIILAADSVVMVIDAANGVEDQTRKLFEVCRRHRLPILTFVNKLDRPSRDPLELLDDLESTLGISAAPVNSVIDESQSTFRWIVACGSPVQCLGLDAPEM